MAFVIVAGVLGSITLICGGLFLRRLLGEITELRRQITRVDRQMRAQRARESFLRQLLILEDEEEDGDDGPPTRAAVAGGHELPTDPRQSTGPEPVRRKKHLGLHIGGAAAAITGLGVAARNAVRAHRGRFAAAVTGASVTAATITLVTVQPWGQDSSQEPPSSAPTVLPTASMPPHYTPPPATTRRPSRSRPPSTSLPGPDGNAGFTPGLSPTAAVTALPAVDETFPLGTARSSGHASEPGGSSSTSGPPRGGSTAPGQPPGQSPGPLPGPSRSSGLCLAVVLDPLLDVDVCLPGR